MPQRNQSRPRDRAGAADASNCAISAGFAIRLIIESSGRTWETYGFQLYTGAGSLTASPINETGQTVDQRASTFQGGSITLAGLSAAPPQLIEHYGVIQAPSGSVNITANQRVYLGPGSSIDVSGLWLDEIGRAHV